MARTYRQAGATVSACSKFRYRLWRQWDDQRLRLAFCMLNPSTADADQDDPTIRRCVGFAERLGYGGIEVVNLFSFRATDPKMLRYAEDPVGPDNDAHIRTVFMIYPMVICAWGANVASSAGWGRAHKVMTIAEEVGAVTRALRLTRRGIPQHPLMLPYSCEPVSYRLTKRD